jgi:hypothetical protein
MRRIAFVVLLFLLAACTAETAVDPVLEPTVTAVPSTAAAVMETIEPTAVPTNPPEPTAELAPVEPTQPPPTEPAPTAVTEEAAEVVVEYGRTPEGAYFKGAADAPVTLIDYSDFL